MCYQGSPNNNRTCAIWKFGHCAETESKGASKISICIRNFPRCLLIIVLLLCMQLAILLLLLSWNDTSKPSWTALSYRFHREQYGHMKKQKMEMKWKLEMETWNGNWKQKWEQITYNHWCNVFFTHSQVVWLTSAHVTSNLVWFTCERVWVRD